ncbi:MAG: alpha/beta hydrolase fold domain-containing protein [Acidimicrobiales bacterium]
MLTYQANPADVDHMIADDHLIVEQQFLCLESGRGDRRALVDQVAFELTLHATAEERVIYPALRDAGLDPEADLATSEHQTVKELLVVLDREDPGTSEFEDALSELIRAVRHHVIEEEGRLLPQLRVSVGPEGMVELGQQFLEAKRSAPTRSHPHAPSTGIGHALTDVAARIVDLARDIASGRQERLATDATGRLVPQAQAIADAYASLGPQPVEILTPDLARRQPGPDAGVRAVLEAAGAHGPEPVGSVEDIAIPDAAGGEQTLRVYRPLDPGPAGDGPQPVILWIHGGGWVLYDIDTYDASCRGLCNKTGAVVVSPDYRRSPEAPFPSAYDDVLAAWRWGAAHAADLGVDPDRMAIGGESVGGTMAAATALALRGDGGTGDPAPSALVCVYPLTTAEELGDSMVEEADARPLNKAVLSWMAMHAFAHTPDAVADWRVDLLSVGADRLGLLPPTLIVLAERDPLRSQGQQLADQMRAAGVDVACTTYAGVMHEFFGAAAVLDEAERAQREAAELFLRGFGVAPIGAGPANR